MRTSALARGIGFALASGVLLVVLPACSSGGRPDTCPLTESDISAVVGGDATFDGTKTGPLVDAVVGSSGTQCNYSVGTLETPPGIRGVYLASKAVDTGDDKARAQFYWSVFQPMPEWGTGGGFAGSDDYVTARFESNGRLFDLSFNYEPSYLAAPNGQASSHSADERRDQLARLAQYVLDAGTS